jgi:hypothetical protein
MKIRKVLVAVSLLAATGYVGTAVAHDYPGAVGSSTSTATATDRFGISCNGGTAKVTLQVRDTVTNPEKATQVRIRGAKTLALLASAPWSTDTTGTAAQNTAFSPLLEVVNGVNTYYFEVNKTVVAGVTGPETYTARIHCVDAGGFHNPEDQNSSVDFWYLNQ